MSADKEMVAFLLLSGKLILQTRWLFCDYFVEKNYEFFKDFFSHVMDITNFNNIFLLTFFEFSLKKYNYLGHIWFFVTIEFFSNKQLF